MGRSARSTAHSPRGVLCTYIACSEPLLGSAFHLMAKMGCGSSPNHSGGCSLFPFVDAHFKIVGERHSTSHKYNIQCLYCPPGSNLIVHHKNWCVDHIGNKKCKGKLLEKVVFDAKQILMGKWGLVAPVPGAELAAFLTLRTCLIPSKSTM